MSVIPFVVTVVFVSDNTKTMNKSFLAIIAATIIIIIVGVIFLSGSNAATTPTIENPPAELEYYWGNGCPHCKIVADFLDTSKHGITKKTNKSLPLLALTAISPKTKLVSLSFLPLKGNASLATPPSSTTSKLSKISPNKLQFEVMNEAFS